MPLWIRRLQPYLLLTLFALPAVWPFTHPGLPRTNDNLPHLYRVVELDRLVQAGVLFPRWAPDLVHGYGYPVFNFFPYLSHYVAEVYHLLGFSFLTAFKAAYVTALLCAAWFAYRLGREYFGETAGLIAGVAYLYSPYLLYNAHIRGALPEITALAILPLTMLYLHRAAWGDRRSVAWAGMALAAFVFAHNAVGLQIMPLLLVYTLFETVTRSALFTVGSDGRLEMGRWKLKFGIWDFLFAIIPFLLGGLLSAFYWLPSLTEIKYVQFSNATANSSMWYFTHFTPLRELLALPRLPVDPDLLNPPVVHSLPLAALVFATVSLLRLPFSPTPKLPGLFFAALALLTTFLVLPASRPVWDALPLLRLTLYPWRLLGLVTLLLAVLAGSLFAGYPTTNHGRPGIGIWDFILSLMLLALMIAGLPLASPPLEPAPTDPTLANVAEFEIPPDLIGTSTAAEFLPAWVKKLPDLAPIRERLVRSERVERFEQPPAGTHIKLAAEGARGHTFSVAAAQPFTFVYRTFYFPGWRATLDGAAAPVRITDPEGLMAVDLPAGEHILTFHFGGTPPRVMGTVLSLIGLAACAALLVISNWRLEIASSALPRVPASPLPRALALFILAIALAAARPLLYDAGYTPLLRRGLTPDGLAGVTHPLDHDFVGELTLLGWDAEREAIGFADRTDVGGHEVRACRGEHVEACGAQGAQVRDAAEARAHDHDAGHAHDPRVVGCRAGS